jgi:hypothetical protein
VHGPFRWPSAGDLDGLRAPADADDGYILGYAGAQVSRALFERGNLDGPRALAYVGYPDADFYQPRLLVKQGRGKEAGRLRWFGFNPDGSIPRS